MAGAGYKLFNTGDVLLASEVNTYLMQQTVMVFANASARTTALSGVLAEGMLSYLADTNATEVYDGSAWVSVSGTGDITAVTTGANSGLAGGVTTGNADIKINFASKGQLAVGTGSGTTDFLNVGTNGHTLVADSTQSTGVKWAAPSSPNFVGVALTLPADQTISNTVATALAFGAGSEQIDTDGFHDTSTNNTRITIPSGKGGKYLVTATCTWVANATGYRELWVQKGASGRTIQATSSIQGSSVAQSQVAVGVLSLSAGDYLQMYVEHNSGGNLNINGDFVQETRFEAYLIGA